MLNYILKQTIHLFNPSFCSYCYTVLEKNEVFCHDCLRLVRPIINRQLPINAHYTLDVFALSAYEEPLRSLILAKNYGTVFAAQQLGLLMMKLLPPEALLGDIIIPIPQHWKSYAKRGFNQAEIIAQALSSSLRKPLIKAVKQVQAVQPHHKTERFTALVNIFALVNDTTLLYNKHILLVDDVMFTGATLVSVAQTISKANPSSIRAVVGCRKIEEVLHGSHFYDTLQEKKYF